MVLRQGTAALRYANCFPSAMWIHRTCEAPDSGDAAVADLAITIGHGEPIERERLELYSTAKRHLRCQQAHDREFGGTRTPTL